jgi:uncharacterized Tic20 family protein
VPGQGNEGVPFGVIASVIIVIASVIIVIASVIIVIASAITFTKGVSALLDRASQPRPA